MKRDTNLLQAIVRKAEESNGPITGSKMEIPGSTPEQRYEHVLMAKEEGLVDARMAGDGVNFTVLRLTAAGHGYLDVVRAKSRSEQADTALVSDSGSDSADSGRRIELIDDLQLAANDCTLKIGRLRLNPPCEPHQVRKADKPKHDSRPQV
jgi:hypothetical protein